MKWRYIFIWIGLGVAVFAYLSWTSHYSGKSIGHEEGKKEGYAQGFKEGREYQAKVMVLPLMEKLIIEQEKSKFPVTDFWQLRHSLDKTFFFSPQASPPLLNTFGSEESFHYIYGADGVYAFPVSDFKYEDVLALMVTKKEAEQPKDFGATPKKI